MTPVNLCGVRGILPMALLEADGRPHGSEQRPGKCRASIGPVNCGTMEVSAEAVKTEGTRRCFNWECCAVLTVVESFDGVAIFNLVQGWCEGQQWIVRFRFPHWACKSSGQVDRSAPLCRSKGWNASLHSVNRVGSQQVAVAVHVAMTRVKRSGHRMMYRGSALMPVVVTVPVRER